MDSQHRPLTAAYRVEALAAAEGMTPLELICSRLADGQSLSSLAAEIGLSRPRLSTYAHSLPGAKERLREARSEGAHAMIDRARDILDNLVTPDRDQIALAKAKIDLITWQAERLNQTEFGGAKQQVNVQVNLGNLSLDAMRNRVVTARAVQSDEDPALPTQVENAAPIRLPLQGAVTQPVVARSS